jgi:hypothetical protein
MFRGMADDREAELRLEIKHRDTPPTPYKWEIYRGSEPFWLERSMESYRTEREAAEAGRRALDRIRHRELLAKPRK